MEADSAKIRAPKDVDLYAGKMLKRRRKEMGFTQKDLAKKLGITFQQVQKYEKGANRIGASRLAEIAYYLQVPPSYFFAPIDEVSYSVGGVSIDTITEADNQSLSVEELLGIIVSLNNIKDKGKRDNVIKLIKNLGNKDE